MADVSAVKLSIPVKAAPTQPAGPCGNACPGCRCRRQQTPAKG